MRTDAGMTGAKFIAVLLVVSLVLTAFMAAPKAAGQEVTVH